MLSLFSVEIQYIHISFTNTKYLKNLPLPSFSSKGNGPSWTKQTVGSFILWLYVSLCVYVIGHSCLLETNTILFAFKIRTT